MENPQDLHFWDLISQSEFALNSRCSLQLITLQITLQAIYKNHSNANNVEKLILHLICKQFTYCLI